MYFVKFNMVLKLFLEEGRVFSYVNIDMCLIKLDDGPIWVNDLTKYLFYKSLLNES